jgi:MFS transporter, BCD family, chlorophyll transporter
VAELAALGSLGPALTGPVTGYGAVYLLEIGLLFVTLAAIGPLVRPAGEVQQQRPARFGLAEFPG